MAATDTSRRADVVRSVALVRELEDALTRLRATLLHEAAMCGATWQDIGQALGTDALGAWVDLGPEGPDPPT